MNTGIRLPKYIELHPAKS